jgi:hypothetical protein
MTALWGHLIFAPIEAQHAGLNAENKCFILIKARNDTLKIPFFERFLPHFRFESARFRTKNRSDFQYAPPRLLNLGDTAAKCYSLCPERY